MRLLRLTKSLPAALALVLATLPLAAQKSQTEIQRDIDFARGLAAQWGFTDMSESVLDRLEKAGPSGRTAEEIQLLQCDIYAIGAARVTDRTKRDELLRTALVAYEKYISEHSNAENRQRAESSYVDTAVNYGRSLSAAAEEAAGAELEAIRTTLQETLTKAVAKNGDLVNTLKANASRTESETRQLWELMMNRGALLLLIARSQVDGSFNFDQAKKVYEEVVDLAEETSSAGLRAFIGHGDVLLAMGQPKDAVEDFLFVGETAIPRDPAVWAEQSKELGSDEVQRRFALLQLATPGVIQSLMASGDTARACAEGMRLLNIWNREGLDLVPPFGYQSLLGIVGALNEAGGFVGGDLKAGTIEWFASAEALQAKFPQKKQQRSALDLALALAQQVNEDNRGNLQGARAQRLIAEIIEQPGVDVSPAILIEAARGKASDRDFLGAIDAYKRVMSAIELQDPSVRLEYGPKVLNAIGRAYLGIDRPLEAALVFQEALTSWLGDPEYDGLNSRGFYNATNQLKRKIKSDKWIDGLAVSANEAVQKHDTQSSGEILFMNAMKVYETKDYSKAREAYKAVPNNTASYEKALVYIGLCEYQLGWEKHDFAAAIRVFDDYLNKYLKDPQNALGAAETTKEARRGEAVATAVFYWGLSEFYKAEAGAGDWKRVVDLLAGYEDRFPGQASFAPAAMYRVILAHYRLGNAKEVDELYAKLVSRYGSSKWTSQAALEIFTALETDYKRLKESKDPADQAKAKGALRKMASYLEVGNQNSTNSSFANLRRESQLWMELEEWAKAEALLTKLESKFATGESAADVEKYVLPDLGRALFEQQKMKECADVLSPLVEAKKATFDTTLILARALSGYAELSTGEDGKRQSMRVVPGVGGVEAMKKASELFGKLLDTVKNKEGAWTKPWLEMKFDQIYCLLVYSKLDSKVAESAKSQVKMLQSEYLGDDLPNLKEADLKAKYAWLFDKLK